jgi:undecaprenyl-diphosphatase
MLRTAIMSWSFDSLIAFGAAHPHAIGGLAFLAALLESLAIVGVVFPGSFALIALGALVPTGAIGVVPLMAWAIAGAIVGDGLSYWLGRRYHEQIRLWRPFRSNPAILARGEALFARHGGKSVFLARFMQGPRSVVPLVAGMVDMPPTRFYAVNIASALVWAPAHIIPGVVFGAALGMAAAVSLRLLLLAVLLLSSIVAAVFATRLLINRGIPLLARLLSAVVRWSDQGTTTPQRWLRALLRPVRNEIPVVLALGVVCAIAFWAFFGVLEDVLTGDPLVRAGAAVFNLLQSLRTPVGDRLMVAITSLGDGPVATGVVAAVLAWLAWRRAWRASAYWLAAIGLSAMFTKGMKALLHMPRPSADLYSGWEAFSFPSGHATNNAVLWGFLTLLALPELTARWRVAVIAATASLVGLIAISRLYLGAHWLPDVLGGMAFALAWIAILGAFYLRRATQPVGAGRLLAVAAAALVLLGSWHLSATYRAGLQRYAVQETIATMPAAAWWRDAWRSLPAARADLIGEWEEPFVLQWAGEVEPLRRQLEAAGWREPRRWSLAAALDWLAPDPDPLRLPVLPKLNEGRLPRLTLIRPVAGSARLVLRLWPSATVLCATDGTPQPLMLASVVEEAMTRVLSILTVFASRPPPDDVPAALAEALTGARIVHPELGAATHRLLLARADSITIPDRELGAPATTVAKPFGAPAGCGTTGSSQTH